MLIEGHGSRGDVVRVLLQLRQQLVGDGTLSLPADAALIKIGTGGGTAVSIMGATIPVGRRTFEHLCSSFEFRPGDLDERDYARLRAAVQDAAGTASA